jgi:hypothetical protein
MTARLCRVQVESVVRLRGGALSVGFNDGIDARAEGEGVVAQVSRAFANAAMVDAKLTGRREAWVIEKLLQPSDEWRRIEIL